MKSWCYKIWNSNVRHAEDGVFTRYKQIVQTNFICKPDDKKKDNKNRKFK